MMENFLFPLNSVSYTWLSPSSTTWAMDMILAFVCGLGLFLLLMPHLESNPLLPLAGKKKTPSKHRVKWGLNKRRKKTGNMKVTRDCLRKLEETQNRVLILQSHLEKLHDKGGLHERLHPDTTSEVLRTGPATDHWTPRQSVENPSPNTSPLPSQSPLTQGFLPLGFPLSVEHQDQFDLKQIPLGTVPQSSGPCTSYLTSLIRNISGLDCCNHSISFLFWWWTTAKALLFTTRAHAKNQQECLSPRLPEASLGEPTPWQTEAGGLSFLEQNVQKLLESMITKRANLKQWEKNDKKGLFFQPMNPDYPLDSPGNLLVLQSNKLNTEPNSFWTRKGKPQKLPSSQQLSYSIDLGNIVQKKYIQLFWGLPSLHSESLVATAWVHKKPSSVQPEAVGFNTVSNSLPIELQAEGPPQLPWAKKQPQEVAQPQFCAQTLSPSVVPEHSQANLPCSFPNQPPSPSQIRSCMIIGPKSQHNAQSLISNEDQNLECPWQKRLKWKILASKFQKSQEAINQPTLNHPQGSQNTHTIKSTSILPGDSYSPELQEHREKQSQDRVIRDEQLHCPPIRFPASQELLQPKDKIPGECQYQAKDKHEPYQTIKPSALTGERTKGVQKVGSMYSERVPKKWLVTFKLVDPNKVHKQDLGRDPEDLTLSSGRLSLRGLMKDSESYVVRPGKCQSGTHLSINLDKEYVEKTLQDHLDRKLELMKEGMIPVCVRKSWLAANHAFPKSNTHTKSINQASCKGQPSRVNTSQELSFLDAKSRLILETGIIRYRVRHKWDSHLQALEPMNVSISEAPASPIPQPAISSSSEYVAKVANFLEEIPQKVLKEKVIKKMSVATLQSRFPTQTPAELQKAEAVTPAGGQCVLAEAHPYEQEESIPLHFSSYNLQSRVQQSRTVLGTGIGSTEPSLSPALEERANEGSEDPSLSLTLLEIQLGSRPSEAKDTKDIVQVKKMSSALEVTMGTSMLANSQIINLDLKGSEVPESSKISSPPRWSMCKNLVDTSLKAQVVRDFEFKDGMDSEKQSVAPGIHLDCHVNMLPTTDSPCSQSSLSSSQCVSSSKVVTFQSPRNLFMKDMHRLVQQQPKLTRVKVIGKNHTKMLDNPDEREDCERVAPGQQEESCAAVRPSQAWGLSPSVKVNETVTTESKFSPRLPEKGQAPSQSPIKRRMNILQHVSINTNGKDQEYSLPKDERLSSSTQNQGCVTSRLFMDRGEAEARVLMKVVGDTIVDKLGLQHQGAPSEMHRHKEKSQTLMGRHYYPSSPCAPEQSQVHHFPQRNVCCGHQDSHKGQSPYEEHMENRSGQKRTCCTERLCPHPAHLPAWAR